MVAAAGKTREEVREELIALGEKLWSEFDTLTATAEWESEKYPGLKAKQIDWEGRICTVTMGVIPGLTHEKHKEFRDGIVEKTPLLSKETTIEELEKVDGCRALLFKLKLPWPVSARKYIVTILEKQNDDGSLYTVQTS